MARSASLGPMRGLRDFRVVDFSSGIAGEGGQHNRWILRDGLGLSESELEDLEAAGVIGERPEGL